MLQTMFVQLYLLAVLTAVITIGDFITFRTKRRLLRAVFDNATHATIGGLSWLLVCLHHRGRGVRETTAEIFLCSAIASLIDLDHFFAAKSLHLKDATHLANRPILHCTTIPLVLSLLMLLLSSYYRLRTIKRLTLLMFTAFFSHHTRDATRRGYWIFPFGSTPAVPYYLYIFITLITPYGIETFLRTIAVDKVYPVMSVDL